MAGFDFGTLMQDPTVQMGLSLLSQAHTYGRPGSLSGALQQFQQLQQGQNANALQAFQLAALKKKMADQQQQEQLTQKLSSMIPQYMKPAVPGALDQGMIAPNLPIQSQQAQQLAEQMGPNPTLSDLMSLNQSGNYAQQGTPQELPLQGTPASFDVKGFQTAALPIQMQIDPVGAMNNLQKYQEMEAARQQRMDEIKAKLADAATARQDKADLARELAQMQIQARQDLARITAAIGGNQPKTPVAYINDKGQTVWGTIREAMGKPAANYSPEIKGQLSQAAATGKGLGERTIAQPQETARMNIVTDTMTRLSNAIDALNNNPGLSHITGPIAGRIPNITPQATSAQAQLDSIKSQFFVNALQAMREASKTGGAVGNVSDKEGQRLESTFAALDQAQGTPDFKKQLKIAQDQVKLSMKRVKQAYEQTYGSIPAEQNNAPSQPSGGWSITPVQ